MTMRAIVAILLASVSVPALAAAGPQSDAAQPRLTKQPAADALDTHIRQVSYSAMKRTDIVGVVGQPTTITFPKGESVYRVVQSEAADETGEVEAPWRGPDPKEVKDSPIGGNLPLWPVRPGVSMMTVITLTADATQKVYAFRLLARPAEAGAADAPGVVLNLIFAGYTATAQQAAAASTVRAAKQRAAEDQRAKNQIRVDAFNAADAGGCHYTAKGKRPTGIEPRCPLDDGQWTLMRFPGLSRKPAVYVVTGENEERLARQHADGDFIVVEEIAQHFRLRLGDDVLDILNTAYDPVGRPAGTGTTAPGVERDVIQARSP